MRIVKYVFLLLLLIIIGVTVYVATQKGDFNVVRSTVIDVPKNVLFNYVNDYKNWEDFTSWKEDDSNMTFVYPDNTVGQGAFYSWSGTKSSGKMITVFVKENDSIAQKVINGESESTSYITFKDTLGKTKITWNAKGNIGFMAKVSATFNGGVNNMVNEMYERSLNNLNKVITKEINTFNVKVNGVVQKQGVFYIKKTTTCKAEEVQARLLLTLPKIVSFFKKNDLNMNGSPFVVYDRIDTANKTVTFSVCGPLKEEIFLSPESDISVGKLESFSALKTTLTGDYSHRSAARAKAIAYLKENSIEENTAVNKIDIYVKSASEIKNPSKWVTEILIPVKTVAPKPTAVATPPTIINEPVITQ